MAVSQKKRADSNQNWIEWYESLVFALVLLVLLFTFVVRIAMVRGSSMVPTLQNGDRVLLQSLSGAPERGDVVVIDDGSLYGKPLVKRVIALGGDTVDIDFDAGTVYINGSLLEESYIAEPTRQEEGVEFPLTVPEGTVFLMGDNRMHSEDSRSTEIGCVDVRDILGKVLFRIFPLNSLGAIR